MEKTVAISGMKCDGCKDIVKSSFEGIEGVTAVDVDLDAKQAKISGADVSLEQLNKALVETKFKAEAIL
ncbi:copper transport protein CopZ [Listeria floridensis FSL S10-1187]|uniref:Copper transport protein CopZ n=1 Tax=Listeria floridensis FSL S10-1187 TaxID=1265817 RepID=A0ABP3AWT7_9LIST|nr:heavy-metal-associated domain-containing protein [Listeria floridensis]EUJ30552.1 copper transport protein CopZ [Listeria floridensis FSL S10-1187]